MFTAQEVCESRGEHPGLPVPNILYDLCGRKATLNSNCIELRLRAQEVCESQGGHSGLAVPNIPYGLCRRKATFELNCSISELRSCVKVELDILGSPSLTFLMVSAAVMQH